MLVEEEFDEILKTVKRLVAMKKSPCLLEQILLEYMQLKGKKIPFKKFGYVNELELFLERGGRGAGDLFTLKDRKGKLYIELRKPNGSAPIIPVKPRTIKSKQQPSGRNVTASTADSIPALKIRKAKSSALLNHEGKKSDKNPNIITERKAASSTNTSTIRNFKKMNLKYKDINENRQQQKRRDNNLKTSTVLYHSFNPSNETKLKKAIKKPKTLNSDNLISNKTKQKEYQNDDECVTGCTALTQVKSLPQYYHTQSGNMNGQLKAKLNFLDWHLINILHTKVMAHPNGFHAHQLPDWYHQTFDRHIEENWFDLINKSNEFIQEKDDDNEVLLFVKNDLDIESIIKSTKSISFNQEDDEEGAYDEDKDSWL